MGDDVLKYNDIAADVDGTKWKIGHSTTTNAGKKFISFAVHLFYGTIYNLDTGFLESDLLRPTKQFSKRESCKNNINSDLLNISYYTGILPEYELKQTYDNEGKNKEIEDTKLDNNSSLKKAILAVIECFVPVTFLQDNDYESFKKWLKRNDGIPDNDEFKAEDVIEKWSVARIKNKYDTLDINKFNDMTKLLLVIKEDNIDYINKELNNINLPELKNNLEQFKDYVSKLKTSPLKDWPPEEVGNIYKIIETSNLSLKDSIEKIKGIIKK
jgi:hypothetical protein